MPYNLTTVANPTSTIALPTLIGRSVAADSSEIVTTISASQTITFKTEEESIPAVYMVYCSNTNGVVFGFFGINPNSPTANYVVFSGSGLLTTTPAANQIQITSDTNKNISLTAHATFGSNMTLKIRRII